MADFRRLPSGDVIRIDVIDAVFFHNDTADVSTEHNTIQIDEEEDVAALRKAAKS